MDNLVIFFRDQTLTVPQHKEFGARFGKLHIHPNAPKPIDGHPEILVVKADENSKRVAGEVWHSDVSCDPEPPMGSILYIHQVPENGGGDTSFANMYAAYETLSETMRGFLEGCTAVHASLKSANHQYRDKTADMKFPESEHPIVRTHPVTGRKALYVNPGFTLRFAGWTDEESRPLLDDLYRHGQRPEFSCRFQWRKGSMAFWDNRATWHLAVNDYHGQRREMHRITVEGCALG